MTGGGIHAYLFLIMINPENVVDKAKLLTQEDGIDEQNAETGVRGRKRPFPGSSKVKKMLVALKMLSMGNKLI